MDVVALLGSPVLVAAVTVLASLITLMVANRHAERMNLRQLGEERERRRFAALESRYEDRRDAAIEFDRAAEKETDWMAALENEHRVSAVNFVDDHEFSGLLAAHARVVMLATPPVVLTADRLRQSVFDVFSGQKDSWEGYSRALAGYREACRGMLSSDVHERPS
ncbi:hypothetical protein H5398_16095 [Tessaracoccus sp. MC1679]|uniref:hypothetical protein n=1 Tax=Tessaracoccus sp. MC1679 TaxID=2760313 RepID=UPI0016016E91|nr:hypothetical protein [Tessaracoccus sp. MC1679]MBB1517472.1 hypothetical protein [Tessaracoccus sp. MC1679]